MTIRVELNSIQDFLDTDVADTDVADTDVADTDVASVWGDALGDDRQRADCLEPAFTAWLTVWSRRTGVLESNERFCYVPPHATTYGMAAGTLLARPPSPRKVPAPVSVSTLYGFGPLEKVVFGSNFAPKWSACGKSKRWNFLVTDSASRRMLQSDARTGAGVLLARAILAVCRSLAEILIFTTPRPVRIAPNQGWPVGCRVSAFIEANSVGLSYRQ